jgi:ABC-type transporter Mla subunit MlaD
MDSRAEPIGMGREVDPRDFGALESDVRALRSQVAKLETSIEGLNEKLDHLNGLLDQARGGWKLVAGVLGACIAAGGLLVALTKGWAR